MQKTLEFCRLSFRTFEQTKNAMGRLRLSFFSLLVLCVCSTWPCMAQDDKESNRDRKAAESIFGLAMSEIARIENYYVEFEEIVQSDQSPKIKVNWTICGDTNPAWSASQYEWPDHFRFAISSPMEIPECSFMFLKFRDEGGVSASNAYAQEAELEDWSESTHVDPLSLSIVLESPISPSVKKADLCFGGIAKYYDNFKVTERIDEGVICDVISMSNEAFGTKAEYYISKDRHRIQLITCSSNAFNMVRRVVEWCDPTDSVAGVLPKRIQFINEGPGFSEKSDVVMTKVLVNSPTAIETANKMRSLSNLEPLKPGMSVVWKNMETFPCALDEPLLWDGEKLVCGNEAAVLVATGQRWPDFIWLAISGIALLAGLLGIWRYRFKVQPLPA